MDGDVAAFARGGSSRIGWRARLKRRTLLRAAGGAGAIGAGLGGYAFGYEPGVALRVVQHRLAPANWPADLRLSIALIADPHCGGPHTPLPRLARAVAMANAMQPDLVVLLGDYLADHRFVTDRPSFREVADVLAGLRAPLGVHAVLGNHDWWEDPAAQAGEAPLPAAAADFAAAGLPILHNAARRLVHDGRPIWLGGLGSQWAYRNRSALRGADDLAATLAAFTDDAPAILLAHEPDIFPQVPGRVAVTLSGHTHGGQVRIRGYSPIVPSRYGNRYAYGAVEEEGRHLVVSGGIGNSMLPVRFGMPSEVTMVELGGPQA
ncbi:metallophosphoesterase [Roseicella aerolata]|uniref:Metallophosphoesterase n=1 Tax=Roseicella aerolata TaxID=2883479 RepID=A0A9X1L7Q2_9PROT|nr:metallophosphoesterase [Roseicella aerolata]MCB4821739.1 metallophosphoesterase [Roseicella aerolata]